MEEDPGAQESWEVADLYNSMNHLILLISSNKDFEPYDYTDGDSLHLPSSSSSTTGDKVFDDAINQVDNDNDGKHVLELVNWDPLLAVSALEREFMVNEEATKRKFHFLMKHGKDLDLELDDKRKLNLLNALPLVSPYSDISKLDVWTLEAEKYRVGLIHEFLNLTLEKRASIHHLVEFKEEFSLTKHTYHMLLKQPRAFYLAVTEMNWVVLLKDGYDRNGVLIHKDPQVVFNEKLYKYAQIQEMETGSDVGLENLPIT